MNARIIEIDYLSKEEIDKITESLSIEQIKQLFFEPDIGFFACKNKEGFMKIIFGEKTIKYDELSVDKCSDIWLIPIIRCKTIDNDSSSFVIGEHHNHTFKHFPCLNNNNIQTFIVITHNTHQISGLFFPSEALEGISWLKSQALENDD